MEGEEADYGKDAPGQNDWDAVEGDGEFVRGGIQGNFGDWCVAGFFLGVGHGGEVV